MLKGIIIIVVVIVFVFLCSGKETFIINNKRNKWICGRKNLNRYDLWKNVRDKHGISTAKSIFPMTYLLPNEIDKLLKDSSPQFILKELNGGARKGVKLFNDKNEIRKEYKNYSVGQVFIKNPLLVNGHKFDIRFFLVTICDKGTFLFKQGYCVYSKEPFDYSSMNRDKKINQAYTDDEHYDIHKLPRTFYDMCRRLNINPNKILDKIITKLKIIIESTDKLCCKEDHNKNHIYGIDVELLDNLQPLILEINASPSLTFSEEWKKNIINNLRNQMKNLT